jgi:hypothetical protein
MRSHRVREKLAATHGDDVEPSGTACAVAGSVTRSAVLLASAPCGNRLPRRGRPCARRIAHEASLLKPAPSPALTHCALLRSFTSAPVLVRTGGDPAAPVGLPRTPQPPPSTRSLTLRLRRRVDFALPFDALRLLRVGPRLALLRLRFVALGRVRKARRSRCPLCSPG